MNVNDLYIADEDFERKITLLKTKLRVRMNGETSAQMERRKLNYTINYGASLQHMKDLSAMMHFTADECRKLWMMNIRETMLIAAMQFPVSKADTEEMLQWARRILTPDMAEQSAFFLFSRIDGIDEFVVALADCKAEFSLATACFSAARTLQIGRKLKNDTVIKLIDKVQSINDINVTEARAISFLLRQIVRQKIDCVDVNELLNSLLDRESSPAKQIAFEVQAEIEMLNN